MTMKNVTLPWNPNDAEEGDYATTVDADSDTEAVRMAAEEMADSGEKQFETGEQREDFIQALQDHGGYVVDVLDDLKYNLGVLFRKQLFPDDVVRDIDGDALAKVLEENRDRLVAKVKDTSPASPFGTYVPWGLNRSPAPV